MRARRVVPSATDPGEMTVGERAHLPRLSHELLRRSHWCAGGAHGRPRGRSSAAWAAACANTHADVDVGQRVRGLEDGDVSNQCGFTLAKAIGLLVVSPRSIRGLLAALVFLAALAFWSAPFVRAVVPMAWRRSTASSAGGDEIVRRNRD